MFDCPISADRIARHLMLAEALAVDERLRCHCRPPEQTAIQNKRVRWLNRDLRDILHDIALWKLANAAQALVDESRDWDWKSFDFADPRDIALHRLAALATGFVTCWRSELKYDPNQPRDDHGRWTSEGGEDESIIAQTTGNDGASIDESPNGAPIHAKPSGIDNGVLDDNDGGQGDTDDDDDNDDDNDDFNAQGAVDNINQAADKLKADQINNGEPNKYGDEQCGHYVGQAIVDGGGLTDADHWPGQAKNFGPWLEQNDFDPVAQSTYISDSEKAVYPPAGYTPQPGDVAVIQPYDGGNPAGHVQMYTGTDSNGNQQWTSDFRQPQGFWPGPDYREDRPSYVIYRY